MAEIALLRDKFAASNTRVASFGGAGSAWTHRLANEIQPLVLMLDVLEPAECLARARAVAGSIPPPVREIDRICGAKIFLSLAIKLSRRLHATVRDDGTCTCELTIPQLAKELVRPILPKAAFHAWLDRFTAVFRGEHPGTHADRAAWLLRSEPARHWTIEALAERVGCRPRTLCREFRATFGVTVRRYHETARVASVYEALCSDGYKISAIADDAGYRSPKDFYRAVRNCLRLTPGSVRALSHAQQEGLGEMLRSVLSERLIGIVDDEPAPHALARAATTRPHVEKPRTPSEPFGRARRKSR